MNINIKSVYRVFLVPKRKILYLIDDEWLIYDIYGINYEYTHNYLLDKDHKSYKFVGKYGVK